MNIKLTVIGTIILLFLLGISGCVEESPKSSKPALTEEDWEYFQFHYKSGDDLYNLFSEGFQALNTHISLYNPENSSFLIEVNETNKADFFILEDIAETISQNVSRYQPELANYSVSTYFTNHSHRQKQLFTLYQNLSIVYNSVYLKVISGYNPQEDTVIYIDISNEMDLVFMIEQLINNYMNAQLDYLADIPDDVSAAWDDNDWSFME